MVCTGTGKKEEKRTGYRVILVDPKNSKIVYKGPSSSLKECQRWVKAWEEDPCGMVAVVWPDRVSRMPFQEVIP
jgi:hypothetical protein